MRHAIIVISAGLFTACVGSDVNDGRISAFGEYEGYSEARFSEWVTTSEYVEMRDGVKLAVDVTRPAVDGVAVDERFPVVWTHSRYHRNPKQIVRAFAGPDEEVPEINSVVDANSGLQRLVRHGYVVASAAVRGSGASFGRYEGLFSAAETADAAEIIDWLAGQPWSDGNVGMFGGSYLGITQYMAASEKPAALKAIFPNVAGLDLYDVLYPGGIFRDDMIDHWGTFTRDLDLNIPAPRVDADVEGTQLRAAIAEHEANWDVMVEYPAHRFRNQRDDRLDWEAHGPSGVLQAIREAAVPAYHWNGWYDIFVTDATLLYANYAGPEKLGIGPWAHGAMPIDTINAERARLTAVEQHRFFDYWLKGIDNGVMDEPPIRYAVMIDPEHWEWKSSDVWPPPATATTYYLSAGPSGSVGSVNDGALVLESPPEGTDRYQVDPTTTTGTATRWDIAVTGAAAMVYPDLAGNDARSLTYTTGPLAADLRVVGHPVVTLFASASTEDADFHVLLEEVDSAGVSHYVTEGLLRASHRATTEAPWDNLGLPYQRSYREDRQLLTPGEVVELPLDLHPTALVFNAGNRIRVTIMGADADNTELPPGEGSPVVEVSRGGELASRIVLPVVR